MTPSQLAVVKRMMEVLESARKDLESTRESGDCGSYDKQPIEFEIDSALTAAKAEFPDAG